MCVYLYISIFSIQAYICMHTYTMQTAGRAGVCIFKHFLIGAIEKQAFRLSWNLRSRPEMGDHPFLSLVFEPPFMRLGHKQLLVQSREWLLSGLLCYPPRLCFFRRPQEEDETWLAFGDSSLLQSSANLTRACPYWKSHVLWSSCCMLGVGRPPKLLPIQYPYHHHAQGSTPIAAGGATTCWPQLWCADTAPKARPA